MIELIEELSQREIFSPMDFEKLREIFGSLLLEISLKNPKVIIICGTNGKGETAHFAEEIIHQTDGSIKTALWTSPHILDYSERFKFEGEYLTPKELKASLSSFLKLYPKNFCNLSFYEISFWLFCEQVVRRDIDCVILEVGLGGRLDAVNLFDADVCILTSISRDHTEYLGNKYLSIVKEKLGVLRTGTDLIYSVRTNYLKDLVKNEYFKSKGGNLKYIDPDLEQMKDYSNRNLAMASLGVEMLIGKSRFKDFPKNYNLLGRGYKTKINGKNLTFYNGHNLDGHKEFLNSKKLENNSLFIFFGKRPKKEIISIVKLYLSKNNLEITFCGIDNHFKILSKSVLDEYLNNRVNIINVSGSKDFMSLIQKTNKEIIVSGSNFIHSYFLNWGSP